MALYVECGGAAGASLPIETGNPVWVESVAAGSASTLPAPTGGGTWVMTVTPGEDGYVVFGTTPVAASGLRRRVLSGVARSFMVSSGDKIAYATS